MKEKGRQGVTNPLKIFVSPSEQQSLGTNIITHSHHVLLHINKIISGSAVKRSPAPFLVIHEATHDCSWEDKTNDFSSIASS